MLFVGQFDSFCLVVPERSAHKVVRKAQKYILSGNDTVVDIDLEKFFDRVNHDRLMSSLARRIEDKRVLQLILRFLTARILVGGSVSIPAEGTLQGGPLSPFIYNVVLDELDKGLKKRGHRFVCYCDDCNIYVRTKQVGEQVMRNITLFIEKKLKLRINSEKSAVRDPQET